MVLPDPATAGARRLDLCLAGRACASGAGVLGGEEERGGGGNETEVAGVLAEERKRENGDGVREAGGG